MSLRAKTPHERSANPSRKATSLIRQTDIYTPIISMTSNVQSKDVDSYFQSGMNDVLAKPFTKSGLFCILNKHLIHLKAIQLSEEVPRPIGVPPLSDQGIAEAIAVGAAQWQNNGTGNRNVLASMGFSDDVYQNALQEYIVTSGMITDGSSIGTSAVFGDMSSRKRSIETIDDDWTAGGEAALMNADLVNDEHLGKKMKQ